MLRDRARMISTTALAAVMGIGVVAAGGVAALGACRPEQRIRLLASACRPNPCAARKRCNPCAVKRGCNPCAAKGCNPCNPCAAKKKGCNPCNPCAAKKKSN